MVKSCIEFNSQKRKATRKNGGKDKKLQYRLMNNATYGKKLKKQN